MYKIRPSKTSSVIAYAIVGLGYVGVDYATSIAQLFYKGQNQSQQYLEEFQIQESIQTNVFRNFAYGLISANFNVVLHIKLNQFLQQRKRSPAFKLAFSPFAAIPYYLLAGFFQNRPLDSVINQLKDDLKILIPIRIMMDFLRVNNFFFPQPSQSNPKPHIGFLIMYSGVKLLNSSLLICLYDKKFQQ